MPNLVSVKGPHARNDNNYIRIQWNMGNSCNYECEYCPPQLHDGSKPWLSKDQYIDAINKFFKVVSFVSPFTSLVLLP